MKNAIIFVALAVLVGFLFPCPGAAQNSKTGAQTPGAAPTAARKMVITGTIYHDATGYYIQGQKPPEVFTINNPHPKVLDNLVKSGRTVVIEAQSILGDNVRIVKIDGKNYSGGKESKAK